MLVLETSALMHKGSNPFLVTRKWVCDETGKHVGLKLQRDNSLEGSIPSKPTKWAVSKVGLCDGLKHRIFLFKSRTAHQKYAKSNSINIEVDILVFVRRRSPESDIRNRSRVQL